MNVAIGRYHPFQKYQFLLPLICFISLNVGLIVESEFGDVVGVFATLLFFYVAPLFIIANVLSIIYLLIKKGRWGKQILVTLLLLLSFLLSIMPLMNFMIKKSGM